MAPAGVEMSDESGCCEVGVQAVQHGSAECIFSMAGEAHVQAMEDVGECGAADTLVCSAIARSCVCGVGRAPGARRGRCAAIHLHRVFS